MVLKPIPDRRTPGVIVAGLQRGTTYRTDVQRDGAGGSVHIHPGDETCSACDSLIDGDMFPGADYANLLAMQRKKHGHTYCRDCLEVADGG